MNEGGRALRWLDANSLEELGVGQGELDDLTQLTDLLFQATDVTIRNVARLLSEHVEHEGVDLSGEDSHDRERRHVQGNTSAGFEPRLVELGTTADDPARARGGLDND